MRPCLVNEQVSNNWLDAQFVPKLELDSALQASITPALFPGLVALAPAAQRRVAAQYDVCYSAHQYYADYTHRILDFFANPCGTATGMADPTFAKNALRLWPQPAQAGMAVWLEGLSADTPYQLLSAATGAQLAQGWLTPNSPLTVPSVAAGLYVLQTPAGNRLLVVQ